MESRTTARADAARGARPRRAHVTFHAVHVLIPCTVCGAGAYFYEGSLEDFVPSPDTCENFLSQPWALGVPVGVVSWHMSQVLAPYPISPTP